VTPLERTGGQAQFIAHPTPEIDDTLAPTLTWLERHLDRDLSVPTIARRAGMSTRSLTRRFREQTGTTPARWVARARVRHAQRLLETTQLSIEQVAWAAGFRSTAVLRERFGRVVGTSPQAYRRAFSTRSRR
jgi:transcriptional regulator GlxA family with amidase domain